MEKGKRKKIISSASISGRKHKIHDLGAKTAIEAYATPTKFQTGNTIKRK